MFLLARSAVCITLVVAALPNRSAAGSDPVTYDTIASQAGGAALAAVDRFCRHDPARCLSAVRTVADASGNTVALSARVIPRS